MRCEKARLQEFVADEMKYLEIREIQLRELEIMKAVAAWFDAHGISYFLAGGSMLGAVRHNGFIPWDDDMDVLVPREDYEKIKEIVKKEGTAIGGYEIRIPGDKEYPYSFIKVVDKRFGVEDPLTDKSINVYLWIDVFPLDHFPDQEEEHHKCVKYIQSFISMIHICTANKEYLKREGYYKLTGKFYKLVIARLCALVLGGYEGMAYHIDQTAKKMNQKYLQSTHYGDGAWPEGMKDYFSEEEVTPVEKHVFEDTEFFIPVNADSYLTTFYGDYMKLPPEDKRGGHYIQVFPRDN